LQKTGKFVGFVFNVNIQNSGKTDFMIKVFVRTYGCLANVADSKNLITYLRSFGCEEVLCEQDADLILINTCSIREKAEKKVFSYLGNLIHLKKEKPYLCIGVVGCMASYKKKDIFECFDHVNFVYGAKDDLKILKNYLADIVEKLFSSKQRYLSSPSDFVNTIKRNKDLKKVSTLSKVFPRGIRVGLIKSIKPKEFGVKRSFINIMSGCNNFCSYCIVPFVRGPEKSYDIQQVLQQVKHDVDSGYKEINFIGQNVNSYQDPKTGLKFADLLREAAQIKGEFWVRFISSHPKDTSLELIKVMAEFKDKICSHVHLPLQSGSNNILKAMNRVYSREHFLDIVEMIRKYLPQSTISTDIIVGFPGEQEQDYLDTRDMMEKVGFDLIYSFVYSPRKYTKAYSLTDDCPHKIKLKRLMDLHKRGVDIAQKNNLRLVGKVVKCLVEERQKNGKLIARESGNVRVEVEGGDEFIGKFVDVKIESAGATKVMGSIV